MATTYSTWADYRNKYRGRLAQYNYEQAAIKAKATIDRLTFGQALNAPDSMKENLMFCECELADAIHANWEADSLLPKGIASANTDGVSISRDTRTTGGEARSEQSMYLDICRRHLRYPVNLMYRGVSYVGHNIR